VGIAHLARVEGALGQFDSAEHMFNEAIPIQRELFRASQQDARMAGALAESLANRGQMLRRAGRDLQAIEDIREAARLLGLAVQYAPDDAGHARDFAVVNNNLSDVLRESSPQEAMAACRAAEQILRDLAQRFPDDDVYQADLAMTCNNLAALYGSAGEWDRAADGYQKSVEQIAPLVAQNPHIPRYRRELAITQSNLSLAYARLRRQAESDAAFRSAAEILKSLAEDFPDQPAYKSSLSALWNNRGVSLELAGKHEPAVSAFAKAVQLQESLLAEGPASASQVGLLEQEYRNYAGALRELERSSEARKVDRKRQTLLESRQLDAMQLDAHDQLTPAG
jgi:tetratricopeptide (TPR) repeat protein